MTNRDFSDGFWVGSAIWVLILILIIGVLLSQSTCNSDLIEHGVKQYNPKTGELEWVEPKKRGGE